MNYKERHMRWMEMMWERHQSMTREEKRKEEVLKIFEGLGDIASCRVEASHFAPWEPSQ